MITYVDTFAVARVLKPMILCPTKGAATVDGKDDLIPPLMGKFINSSAIYILRDSP